MKLIQQGSIRPLFWFFFPQTIVLKILLCPSRFRDEYVFPRNFQFSEVRCFLKNKQTKKPHSKLKQVESMLHDSVGNVLREVQRKKPVESKPCAVFFSETHVLVWTFRTSVANAWLVRWRCIWHSVVTWEVLWDLFIF